MSDNTGNKATWSLLMWQWVTKMPMPMWQYVNNKGNQEPLLMWGYVNSWLLSITIIKTTTMIMTMTMIASR